VSSQKKNAAFLVSISGQRLLARLWRAGRSRPRSRTPAGSGAQKS